MFSRLCVLFFFAAAMIFYGSPAFAGKMELTTYYPAPYGEYSQLSATGKSTNPDSVVVFQALGKDAKGLVVTNDGLARANNGLVLQNCTGTTGTAPCPTSPVSGQIWMDTSVSVP